MESFINIKEYILTMNLSESNSCVMSKQGNVYYEKNLQLDDLKEDEVKVRPIAVGVCGTDIKILNKLKPCVDGAIGHEATAIVVSSGDNAKEFKRGDFVAISPHIHEEINGKLYNGNIGFSEGKGVLTMEQNLHKSRIIKIDEKFEELNYAVGLTQSDGLACCIRSQKAIDFSNVKNAIILGAGSMGMFHSLLLKSKNIEVTIADINQTALDFAMYHDVSNKYVLSNELYTLNNIYDLVIVCNGDPASYSQAFDIVRNNGEVNMYASMFNKQRSITIGNRELDIMKYHLEEHLPEVVELGNNKSIRVSGALGYESDEFSEAINKILTKEIDPTKFITSKFNLSSSVIDEILSSYEKGGKIMIYPYMIF